MDRNPFKNPFRQGNGNQQTKSKKESDWGKVKFNPISRTAATEQATPWAHFKNDLINQQAKSTLENDANAQEILRKREENYRKNLILSKRKEPTQWEDFSDETQPKPLPTSKKTKDKNDKKKKKGSFQELPSKITNFESIKKENFDSKSLTVDQNMYIKRLITKNCSIKKGGSLGSAVYDLKKNGVIRQSTKGKVKNKNKKK